jgi:hypothetical protein
MNDKIKEAFDKICNISTFVAENCGNADTAKYMNDIISIVHEAVSEPLRNYEVGTPEEQLGRHVAFCSSHDSCEECPFGKLDVSQCIFRWFHMPYNEGGTNEQQ